MSKFNISMKFHISKCGPDDINATNCRDFEKFKKEEELRRQLNLTEEFQDYEGVITHE